MATESAACERCGGTGWVLEALDGRKQARPCSCQRETLKRERIEAAGIPARYRVCNFANFNERNEILTSAKTISREFVDTYPVVPAGLLLIGPSGRGKTHLACAILSELVLTKGVSGLYVDFSELLLRIQTSFRPDADISKESVLTPYSDAELLVLDELGASKPHPWVTDVLYNLLNTRYNRERITVATTNFEDQIRPGSGERETLEERIGYRLRSRLYEMCRIVPLQGEDYRKEIRAQSIGF